MVLFLSDLAHGCSFSQYMSLPWSTDSQKKPEDTWVQIDFIPDGRQSQILTSG